MLRLDNKATRTTTRSKPAVPVRTRPGREVRLGTAAKAVRVRTVTSVVAGAATTTASGSVTAMTIQGRENARMPDDPREPGQLLGRTRKSKTELIRKICRRTKTTYQPTVCLTVKMRKILICPRLNSTLAVDVLTTAPAHPGGGFLSAYSGNMGSRLAIPPPRSTSRGWQSLELHRPLPVSLLRPPLFCPKLIGDLLNLLFGSMSGALRAASPSFEALCLRA